MAAVILLALAGAGLVLLSTARYGAGVSPDSVAYFDAARSLISGKGFVFHTGEPLVWWPPLYPILLAVIGFVTRLDPSAFAHIVNAALFVLVICLSAHLFRTAFRQNSAYSLLGVGAVALAIPLNEVYAMVWSECLFIPLVFIYLIFALHYWGSHGVLSLAVIALTTALACLTRYAGVALVLAGVATIVLASGVSFRIRLARACAFTAVSLLPLGLWVMHNYRLTGTFFGHRGCFRNTLADNLHVGVETVLSWYASGWASTSIVLAWIVVVTIAVMSSRERTRRLAGSLKVILLAYLPAVLFLTVYFVTLLAAAMRDAAVDARTLSPVYVVLVLLLLKLTHELFVAYRPFRSVAANKAPALLLSLWLCFAFTSVARSSVGHYKNGAGGYNTRATRESQTVAWARHSLPANQDVRVYSNYPDVLWALAGVNADETPCGGNVNLSSLKGRWPVSNGSILVWFKNKTWRTQLFSLDELRQISNIEEVAHFSDGSVYRVSVRDTAAPD